METEKDEIKSCVFHGFLNRFLNGFFLSIEMTLVELWDQRLKKIKDSSAKRQDGLQLNLEPFQSKLY